MLHATRAGRRTTLADRIVAMTGRPLDAVLDLDALHAEIEQLRAASAYRPRHLRRARPRLASLAARR